ncbi:amidase-like protein [Penicillium riverlandense]|uniref:amidase-like protein n=1 Tax=Penicillium riverlandense TaxID=1903569 RepID=UPI0025482382|nr:amidase-like protein [Penicillium riverlandense]KAJ5820350.1 amidase-like protein [Penicillium riverlandense]
MDPPTDPLLFLPAHELQSKLTRKEITSVQLVEAFLAQIEHHNHHGRGLNAIISTCPKNIVLSRAKWLDEQRQLGHTQSKLHGIPIVIKDAIVTDESLGMPTTVGSHVFASLRARRNASVITKLIDAGMIILAKANMTEFCGLKSDTTAIGWSAQGGQTLSPYRQEGLDEDEQPTAGGSSSGSAVSIAAGFAPLAIGTETAGSTVYPASVNGLYGMKITPTSTALDGVFKLSSSFDGIGIMARDPFDLAALTEVLLTTQAFDRIPREGYSSIMGAAWTGLRLGVVDIKWGIDDGISKGKWDSPEVKATYEAATEEFIAHGARLVYPLQIPEAKILKHDGHTLRDVAIQDFLLNFWPDPQLQTLEDIIEWNKKHDEAERLKHLDIAGTTQTEIIASLKSTMSPESHASVLSQLRRLASVDGMEKWMAEQSIDIVLGPSDSTLVSFAACAGWPIATMPLGKLGKNGQPYGFFALARSGREDTLFRLMSAFYRIFSETDR